MYIRIYIYPYTYIYTYCSHLELIMEISGRGFTNSRYWLERALFFSTMVKCCEKSCDQVESMKLFTYLSNKSALFFPNDL